MSYENKYSASVREAFRDWNENRAYVDNGGNYRVRPEAATPTHRPGGKVAPWNKEVKRLFSSCREFHAAAQASQGGVDIETGYKMYSRLDRQTPVHVHTCMFCGQSGTKIK